MEYKKFYIKPEKFQKFAQKLGLVGENDTLVPVSAHVGADGCVQITCAENLQESDVRVEFAP